MHRCTPCGQVSTWTGVYMGWYACAQVGVYSHGRHFTDRIFSSVSLFLEVVDFMGRALGVLSPQILEQPMATDSTALF